MASVDAETSPVGQTLENEPAFLAFSLGPVQPFIAAARTVRDLWTGSHLLAWLTRQAMQPILDHRQCGDDSLILPDMKGSRAKKFRPADLSSPCLPNHFVATVPMVEADDLERECRKACRASWQEISSAVRSEITSKIRLNLEKWLAAWEGSLVRLWDSQVNSFFEMHTVVLPISECTEETLAALIHEDRRSSHPEADLRHWTDCMELVGGLLAAQKAIRPIPPYKAEEDPDGHYPPKCSLMGTYEQLGPADFAESSRFWADFTESKGMRLLGTWLRKRDRLCAVSLVKRYAWPAYFTGKVPADPRLRRYPDMATVAAAEWLLADNELGSPKLDPDAVRRLPENRDKVWSGQWLHWPRLDYDEEEYPCPGPVWKTIQLKKQLQGKPPIYYAILMLDGDRMGEKLRAGVGREYYRRVSLALSEFSLDHVRQAVKDHNGVLVYSGGDDALALLPTGPAVACAHLLSDDFRSAWARNELPLPKQATVSAGLAIVHFKEDLRFALDIARRAEKMAKQSGRNTLMIAACRRSGEHSWALCPWHFVSTVEGWVEAFRGRASDQWAYHLAAELPTLVALESDAMEAEIRRQIGRAEEKTRRLFGDGNAEAAAGRLVEAFREFRTSDFEGATRAPRFSSDAEGLRQFVTLCQIASFLARGRDK